MQLCCVLNWALGNYVEKLREDVRGLPGAQMRGTRGNQIREKVNSNGNGDTRHKIL